MSRLVYYNNQTAKCRCSIDLIAHVVSQILVLQWIPILEESPGQGYGEIYPYLLLLFNTNATLQHEEALPLSAWHCCCMLLSEDAVFGANHVSS